MRKIIAVCIDFILEIIADRRIIIPLKIVITNPRIYLKNQLGTTCLRVFSLIGPPSPLRR
jgi:hypothetical protein